jgi:hypothetical protein
MNFEKYLAREEMTSLLEITGFKAIATEEFDRASSSIVFLREKDKLCEC